MNRVLLRASLMLLACVYLSACSGLLFYPTREHVRTPADVDIVYRDVTIQSDGLDLHAWWLPVDPDVTVKGTVYFLHGNAQNISTHLASVFWLPAEGYQVLLLDYRGYGLSEGVPKLPEVFHDIEQGIVWLQGQEDVAGKPLFLLGQSLGASMSGFVVASRADFLMPFDAIVLDTAFSSYPVVAQEAAAKHWLTWMFQYPARATMPGQYDLIDVVENISPTPLLIIHGQLDLVVAPHHGELLFERAGKPKSMLRYDGPHIGTFMDVGNRQLLLDYFARAVDLE